jgi:transcriptional regulatory protein LevR
MDTPLTVEASILMADIVLMVSSETNTRSLLLLVDESYNEADINA